MILACLIGAAVLMAIFITIELRTRYPMLDLNLFRNPAFNGVSAVAFCLSAGMFALFLYITIYMQGVLDYSPLEAGLRFLPLTVLGFIASPVAGALSNRVAIRVLLGIGLGLVGVGLLLMHGISPDSEWTTLLVGFLVAGHRHRRSPTRASARRRSPSSRCEKSGMGSGINSTFRQVGIATGVAGLGAIFQSQVNSKLGRTAAARAEGARRNRRLERLARGRSAAPAAGDPARKPSMPPTSPSSAPSTRSS